MEVHSHTHTERKKWTHYLWEFLMLFLAVFCGFLAENFREHKVEKDRAKQFIHSAYEDLQSDTARLTGLIKSDDQKIAALSSIGDCYETVSHNLESTACMSKLIIFSKTNRNFTIADRTLRQLANAGGFRILNKDDADSILSYENIFKQYLNFESTAFQQAQDNVRNTLSDLADFRVINRLQTTTSIQGLVIFDSATMTLKSPVLFSDDRKLLNKWFNQMSLYLRVTNGQRSLLARLKDKAIVLLEYYKRKYHFE